VNIFTRSWNSPTCIHLCRCSTSVTRGHEMYAPDSKGPFHDWVLVSMIHTFLRNKHYSPCADRTPSRIREPSKTRYGKRSKSKSKGQETRHDIEGGVDRTGGGLNTMLQLMVVLFAMRHERTGRTSGHWINKIDAVQYILLMLYSGHEGL